MEKIRIGQIGIGHNHGEAKMLTARKFPEIFDVVGYCETDEEWIKSRGNIRGYQGLPRMSEEELLSKVDAVLVECDVWNLTKTAQRCIDAGKHIHMDKPASGTVEEFAALLNAAEKKNLVVQMGYMYRYNPAICKTLEVARTGELGDIYEIIAEMSTAHADSYREWLKHFKGGSMYIFGSHLIDLIVGLLGEPDKVTPFIQQSGKNGIFSDDNTTAILEYPHTLVRVVNSSVEMDGWGRRQFTVCGSKGTVEIMPLENPTRMYYSLAPEAAQKAYSEVRVPADMQNIRNDIRYDTMMQDFAAYIRGEKENPYSYAHDLAVHRTVLKACGYVL